MQVGGSIVFIFMHYYRRVSWRWMNARHKAVASGALTAGAYDGDDADGKGKAKSFKGGKSGVFSLNAIAQGLGPDLHDANIPITERGSTTDRGIGSVPRSSGPSGFASGSATHRGGRTPKAGETSAVISRQLSDVSV